MNARCPCRTSGAWPHGGWRRVWCWRRSAGAAPAAERVALVVGNAAYRHTDALRNPGNDAADMAAVLRKLGFEVIHGSDLGRDGFYDKLGEFGEAARGAEAALFFYAGHGLQVDGKNWLAPVDARFERRLDLESKAVELTTVLDQMRGGTNLVLLDACRDNPLAGDLARSMGLSRTVAARRGLARVAGAGETLIAYATSPGDVASDGAGRNSPFTEALLEHIATPGLSVNDLFTEVTGAVKARTGGRQKPWTHISLSKRFYFLPASGSAFDPGPSPTTRPEAGDAARAYEAAERIDTIAAYRLVVESFPGTVYAGLAQARLDKLGDGSAPGSSPSPSPASGGGGAAAGAEESPAWTERALGLTVEARKRVQRGLASLGYDVGVADGVFGRRTRAGIEGYQRDKGLPRTGHLTREVYEGLAALGEEVARAQAEEAKRREEKGEREPREVAQAESEEHDQREEAARRADDDAFASARAHDTADAYSAYLEAYPFGRHAAQARRQHAQAETRERKRREYAPGRRFRDCPECPELVVVPSGTYMMGSPPSETEQHSDEGPSHRVTIAESFAVGVFEVTVGEFERFVKETGHSSGDRCWTYEGNREKVRSGRSWRNPGYSQTGRHPVVCVSREDAAAYVGWLSDKTGARYRLLSESEWEYVARGGSRESKYWGDSVSGQCRHANGADASGRRRFRSWLRSDYWDHAVSCDDGHADASTVGSLSSNPFGLHDVLGNVWEWVDDCWHDDYQGAPTDGSAWTDGGNCDRRVLRGGAWDSGPGSLRSANRTWFRFEAGGRYFDAGFRVARSLD